MQLFFTRVSFGLGGFVLGVIATRLAILPAPSLDSVTEPATPQPPVGAERESELAQAREQIEELTREIARRATAAAPISSPAPLATPSPVPAKMTPPACAASTRWRNTRVFPALGYSTRCRACAQQAPPLFSQMRWGARRSSPLRLRMGFPSARRCPGRSSPARGRTRGAKPCCACTSGRWCWRGGRRCRRGGPTARGPPWPLARSRW